jgi:hypothetical protein
MLTTRQAIFKVDRLDNTVIVDGNLDLLCMEDLECGYDGRLK